MLYCLFRGKIQIDSFREIVPGTELVDVINYNDTVLMELYKQGHLYTVYLDIKQYDEYNKEYFWEPLRVLGIYDSKARAIEEAKYCIGQMAE